MAQLCLYLAHVENSDHQYWFQIFVMAPQVDVHICSQFFSLQGKSQCSCNVPLVHTFDGSEIRRSPPEVYTTKKKRWVLLEISWKQQRVTFGC